MTNSHSERFSDTRARVLLLLVTIWVGSLLAIGYLVAPVLFATLDDRHLAGTIAGRLFRIEAYVSLACGFGLLALCWRRQRAGGAFRTVVRLGIAMLVCTLVGYFAVQPMMTALREQALAEGVALASSAQAGRFGLLHGISSAIYLVQTLLGLGLIWCLPACLDRTTARQTD